MSQTSENNVDNFEVRPRAGANQEDASIGGGMPILQATGHANPTPIQPADPTEAERAEAAYQGIMASLPTFI
ncbi:hypothetical protein LIER_21993 [Lithospermum erythrorhizon]|uniref:Uncharacterized protein n=1 Tax=Lithospermum erythrorhizon TaxID=34254 RepID=A0AAV3QTR8_LITER